MPDLERGICCKCINDVYFSDEIARRGVVVTCAECEVEGAVGIAIDSLGSELEPLLRLRYELGGEYRAFDGYDDDRGHYEQHGDDLSDIVQDVLGEYFKSHDEIVKAVMDAEDYDAYGGEEPYWTDDRNYVLSRQAPVYERQGGWHSTEAELMHGRRFFSPAAKSFFSDLFADIDDTKCWEDGRIQPVCYNLPSKTALYRARVVDSNDAQQGVFTDPVKEMGPPPSSIARSGRMNPAGVSALYTSLRRHTCIAEMRPAIGSTLAVVKLRTCRDLRVLDFRRLEQAFGEISFFDPEYAYKQARLRSLRQLHALVSKPVLPGNDSDYLITQTMAEYLAHVCENPFDGVLFSSAQHKSGVNLVIFSKGAPFNGGMSRSFGVRYMRGRLDFIRIKSVAVSWGVLEQRVDEDGVSLMDEDGAREFDEWN